MGDRQIDPRTATEAYVAVSVLEDEIRFIRLKRALGLKNADMLTPLGVVS